MDSAMDDPFQSPPMDSAMDDPFQSMAMAEPNSVLTQKDDLSWQLFAAGNNSDRRGSNLVANPDAESDDSSGGNQLFATRQELANSGEMQQQLPNVEYVQFQPGEAQRPTSILSKSNEESQKSDSENEEDDAADSGGDVPDIQVGFAGRRKTKKHRAMSAQQQMTQILQLKEQLKMFPVAHIEPNSKPHPLRKGSNKVSAAPSTPTSWGAVEDTEFKPCLPDTSPQKTSPKRDHKTNQSDKSSPQKGKRKATGTKKMENLLSPEMHRFLQTLREIRAQYNLDKIVNFTCDQLNKLEDADALTKELVQLDEAWRAANTAHFEVLEEFLIRTGMLPVGGLGS